MSVLKFAYYQVQAAGKGIKLERDGKGYCAVCKGECVCLPTDTAMIQYVEGA